MSKFALHELSPKYQAQVMAQLEKASAPKLAPAAPPAKRIRQNSTGMNKWEQEFRDFIAPKCLHIHREVSLPLANGLRYKVDFLCVAKWPADTIQGFEVKGFARSTGIAKLKMAATVYPWISFKLVTKRKGGTWDIEDVLAIDGSKKAHERTEIVIERVG